MVKDVVFPVPIFLQLAKKTMATSGVCDGSLRAKLKKCWAVGHGKFQTQPPNITRVTKVIKAVKQISLQINGLQSLKS